MRLDFCYFKNDKGKSFHKAPFGIVQNELGKYEINFNKGGFLYHTEKTYKDFNLLNLKDQQTFKYCYRGIVLKDDGSYIGENERVLVIDVDMKSTDNYSFSDEERRVVYIIVCELFGIPLNYREMEITQSKGIHIFVKVKREQILRNGSFFIDDKTFCPCEQQTARKIEVEVFQMRKCIITVPSEGYSAWKKSEDRIDWKNLMLLETLPEVITWEKESTKKSNSTTESKMSVGNNPELERKLELIYKDLFFEPVERELSSLKFDYSQQPYQIFRVATGENVQLFQREDKTFFIDEVRFKKLKRNYKKTKYFTPKIMEKLEQRKDNFKKNIEKTI